MIPFHLAFPVDNLDETRTFYVDLLGCEEGRSARRWIDFNFYGHQISAHLRPEALEQDACNSVDGDQVPVRHFGAVLPWEEWHALGNRLMEMNFDFIIPPKIRFKGQIGEQGTFFIKDPSGNALEFKTFRDPSRLFLS